MARDLDADATAATSPFQSRPRDRRLIAMCEGERIELALPASGTVTVGRSRECDLRIDHPSVSRIHLRIRVRDVVSVEDAGSANGSRLRGKVLPPSTAIALEPGEVIEIGRAMVVFDCEREVAPIMASPEALGVVVGDAVMKRLYDLVVLVARGDINVLLRGETGAGKEVVAHAIHQQSPRASRPILALNCAAVPEALFESELFGHERGAFTGATTAKDGLVAAADGGTLFLDEVGEMPLAAQAKMLRVIERREVTRVGSTRAAAVDVRFIAATHRDLEQAIADGTFREDLFYRLNGVSLVVPPLRERPNEIRLLGARFLAEACAKLGRPPMTITSEALTALERHPWPGNVRELRNVMDRAALLCTSGAIRSDDVLLGVPAAPAPPPPPSSRSTLSVPAPSSAAQLGQEIEELERRRILQAMEECGGNQTLAAKRLGISRRKLLSRLDEYAVPRPRKRQ